MKKIRKSILYRLNVWLTAMIAALGITGCSYYCKYGIPYDDVPFPTDSDSIGTVVCLYGVNMINMPEEVPAIPTEDSTEE